MSRNKKLNSELSPKTVSAVRVANAARPSKNVGRSLTVAVSTRRPTPPQERRIKAAANVFLAELVRQHLRCGKD